MKKMLSLLILLALSLPTAAADITANVRIQVLVDAQTKHGRFQDAIYYTQAEYAAISNAGRDAAVAKRVADWVAAVDAAKTAPTPPPPSKEELEARLVEVQAEQARLTTEAADLAAKILVAAPKVIEK